MADISFSYASAEDLPHVVRLLSECGLPHEDIHRHLSGLIVATVNDRLMGCVALELYGETALLRSLAVTESHRNRGAASELVERILAYARLRRVEQIFLLTTTAHDFFAKRGFEIVQRSSAPNAIAATDQFRSLCPSEASCMRKLL